MSTFNKSSNNQPVNPVDTHHESGILTMRRGLSMFPALIALLLMGALLLAWPMSRAAAAAEAPVFQSLTTAAVQEAQGDSITIEKPADTVDGDLLIAAVIHAPDGELFPPDAPTSDWTEIDQGQCTPDAEGDFPCTLAV